MVVAPTLAGSDADIACTAGGTLLLHGLTDINIRR
jgi:hypothetical protein